MQSKGRFVFEIYSSPRVRKAVSPWEPNEECPPMMFQINITNMNRVELLFYKVNGMALNVLPRSYFRCFNFIQTSWASQRGKN